MDISNNEIRELVRGMLTPDQIERSFIFWYKKVFHKGERVDAGMPPLVMPFEGTLIFVDLAPRSNWAHPCLYILVENNTLSTKVLEGSLPPGFDQYDDNYIILLRYGHIPSNERHFNAYDK